MRFTHRETEAIRQLAEAKEIESLETLSVTEIDVYSAFEIACLRCLENERHRVLFPLLSKWETQFPMLKSAVETLIHGAIPPRINSFQPRLWEFFPITNASWNDNDHHLFESRFTAGLRQAGFGRKSIALAGAFFEMADNVTQHSGMSSAHPARGILGYHVQPNKMTFAVGDVGRGVLSSLIENPVWSHLQESSDALEAIVRDHASRRIGMGPGNGFLQILKSLADMNGHLVFRSGNGVLTISGKPDMRHATKGSVNFFQGFQLSVSCSVK
jgi:hypothetical protein